MRKVRGGPLMGGWCWLQPVPPACLEPEGYAAQLGGSSGLLLMLLGVVFTRAGGGGEGGGRRGPCPVCSAHRLGRRALQGVRARGRWWRAWAQQSKTRSARGCSPTRARSAPSLRARVDRFLSHRDSFFLLSKKFELQLSEVVPLLCPVTFCKQTEITVCTTL